jgi:hypothetical protein
MEDAVKQNLKRSTFLIPATRTTGGDGQGRNRGLGTPLFHSQEAMEDWDGSSANNASFVCSCKAHAFRACNSLWNHERILLQYIPTRTRQLFGRRSSTWSSQLVHCAPLAPLNLIHSKHMLLWMNVAWPEAANSSNGSRKYNGNW